MTVTLQTFLNTLYVSTSQYDNLVMFVKRLFRRAGNNGLYGQSDSAVYKIVNGERTLTSTQMEGINIKTKLHSLVNFLTGQIPEESTVNLLTFFGVENVKTTSRDALMFALANQFFRCVNAPNNEADDIVPEYYEKAVINPSIMFDPTDLSAMTLFINEVDNRCPVCSEHKKFTYKRDGTPSNFTLIRIYPEGLSGEIKNEYLRKLGKEPESFDSFDNNIAVCRDCANMYCLLGDNAEESLKLKKLKEGIKQRKKVQAEAYNADLSPQISQILTAIKTNKVFEIPDEEIDLLYDPVDVKRKIPDDPDLCEKVTLMSLRHYENIRKHFAVLDKSEEGTFDDIATSVKHIYNKFAREYDTHEEVFNALVDWLNERTFNDNNYRTACEIVIAFFVQDCEVFKI